MIPFTKTTTETFYPTSVSMTFDRSVNPPAFNTQICFRCGASIKEQLESGMRAIVTLAGLGDRDICNQCYEELSAPEVKDDGDISEYSRIKGIKSAAKDSIVKLRANTPVDQKRKLAIVELLKVRGQSLEELTAKLSYIPQGELHFTLQLMVNLGEITQNGRWYQLKQP
jgi:hypothetical protein